MSSARDTYLHARICHGRRHLWHLCGLRGNLHTDRRVVHHCRCRGHYHSTDAYLCVCVFVLGGIRSRSADPGDVAYLTALVAFQGASVAGSSLVLSATSSAQSAGCCASHAGCLWLQVSLWCTSSSMMSLDAIAPRCAASYTLQNLRSLSTLSNVRYFLKTSFS